MVAKLGAGDEILDEGETKGGGLESRLRQLFVSRVRVELLEVFFGDPQEMYHVRGLVRAVGEEINAVRRELARMEKAGLARKEARGNRLYYSLNWDFAFFEELLSMVVKVTGLGAAIIKNRHKLGRVNFCMFSGRFARRLPRANEDDVDVLVVGDLVLPELAALIRTEENRRQKEINYTPLSKEEFQFRKERRDPFLTRILSGSRVVVIGDEAEWVG